MSTPPLTPDRTRWVLVISAAIIVGVLLIANAHLVYVAFSSQPDSVTHLMGEGEQGP